LGRVTPSSAACYVSNHKYDSAVETYPWDKMNERVADQCRELLFAALSWDIATIGEAPAE
jgi:hypothetical protein